MFPYVLHVLKIIIRFAIPMIVITGIAGCSTITSDELIPKAFSLPTEKQRFGGSVNVNVMMDVESIGIIRPREVVSLNSLAANLNLKENLLIDALSFKDIEIGRIVDAGGYWGVRFENNKIGNNITMSALPFGRVHTPVIFANNQYAREVNPLIKESMEKFIASYQLFERVGQAKADYVLDVWIDRVDYLKPITGIGEYTSDVFSIWRLIRVSDGKVLACDFVIGHGINAQMGFEPVKRAFYNAVQNMILIGFNMLLDRSTDHLSALVPTGISRPSIGLAIPAGVNEWKDRIRQNWSKLHKGMTIGEVEAAIGPISVISPLWVNERIYRDFSLTRPSWDYEYVLPLYSESGVGALIFHEHKTSMYKLIFTQGPYKYSEAPKFENPYPPKLLIWELKDS